MTHPSTETSLIMGDRNYRDTLSLKNGWRYLGENGWRYLGELCNSFAVIYTRCRSVLVQVEASGPGRLVLARAYTRRR